MNSLRPIRLSILLLSAVCFAACHVQATDAPPPPPPVEVPVASLVPSPVPSPVVATNAAPPAPPVQPPAPQQDAAAPQPQARAHGRERKTQKSKPADSEGKQGPPADETPPVSLPPVPDAGSIAALIHSLENDPQPPGMAAANTAFYLQQALPHLRQLEHLRANS